jgi:hypothetical protein
MSNSDFLKILGVAGVALVLGGCQKAAKGPDEALEIRETKIVLQECNAALASETLDADLDGKPEIYVVREGPRLKCRRVDLDFDGRTDRTTHYDPQGGVARVESDFDRDGRVDEIALYSLGTVTEKQRATSLDGRLDTWEYYQSGRLVRAERDENGDGIVDQWWDYQSPSCPLIHVDLDADGRPDPAGTLNYCEATGEKLAPEAPRSAGASGPGAAPGRGGR